MWKQRIKTIIQPFSTNGPTVPVVVSPDVDGVLCLLILNHYTEQQFGKKVEVVGTYNSKLLYATTTFEEAKKALWIDLDIRFEGVAHIGQHLLGDIPLNENGFNPNHFFKRFTIFQKYPFGTSHLLLWSLFESEQAAFPVFREKFSLAQAALVHCDSTYQNCRAYNGNCKDWVQLLEPTSKSMQLLLSGEYHEKALKVHTHLCNIIDPYVYGTMAGEGWEKCSRKQSLRSTMKIKPLLQELAKIFRCDGVPLCEIEGAQRVFSGRLERWNVGQIQELALNPNVVSHAIINRKYISVTVS